MLELNHRGLLVPNYNLPATLAELTNVFVARIGNEHRQQLFNQYINYLGALTETLNNEPFKQWIDGSFVTTIPKPGDVDLVSFINYEIVERYETALTPFKYPASMVLGVDAYIVKVYPADHRLFALYAGDRAYWVDRFDKTRRNQRGIIYPKGFVELSFPETTT